MSDDYQRSDEIRLGLADAGRPGSPISGNDLADVLRARSRQATRAAHALSWHPRNGPGPPAEIDDVAANFETAWSGVNERLRHRHGRLLHLLDNGLAEVPVSAPEDQADADDDAEVEPVVAPDDSPREEAPGHGEGTPLEGRPDGEVGAAAEGDASVGLDAVGSHPWPAADQRSAEPGVSLASETERAGLVDVVGHRFEGWRINPSAGPSDAEVRRPDDDAAAADALRRPAHWSDGVAVNPSTAVRPVADPFPVDGSVPGASSDETARATATAAAALALGMTRPAPAEDGVRRDPMPAQSGEPSPLAHRLAGSMSATPATLLPPAPAGLWFPPAATSPTQRPSVPLLAGPVAATLSPPTVPPDHAAWAPPGTSLALAPAPLATAVVAVSRPTDPAPDWVSSRDAPVRERREPQPAWLANLATVVVAVGVLLVALAIITLF